MASGVVDRTRQTAKFLTAAGIGTSLLVISALILTATVIAIVMATPVLVIFSPVLVPASVVALLAFGGFAVSGGFGVAALSALAWIYNYVAGKRPVGSEQMESLRRRTGQWIYNYVAGKMPVRSEQMEPPRRMTGQTAWGLKEKDRTRQTAKFVTAAGIGTSLLVISALIVTATVIAIVMATPVLVIFSPLLVPAGAVALLAAGGFAVSSGFGVSALSALAWIYNYVAGKRPVGWEQIESVRRMIGQTAWGVEEKDKDYGHYVQHKAQEVTS